MASRLGRVADNLGGMNLVEVIKVFIREMEKFAPFVLFILGSATGVATNKLHEANRTDKMSN